jgi:hypothetical protein
MVFALTSQQPHRGRSAGYLVGLLLSLYSMAGCAAVPQFSETAGDVAREAAPADAMANSATAAKVTAPEAAPVATRQPQLIKRANLALTVSSVDESLEAVATVVQTQQGDILDLQDHQPEAGQYRRAYVRIRVPQANLEQTLKALAALGTVDQRSITAEDVSTQLVDLQARLRNLRTSEEALLKLMDRSGSISDVLEVSRELSGVREQIEQLDAQLKTLQTQVSYSTLELTLKAAVTSTAPARPLTEKVGDAWQQATQSVGQFTVGLLQIGLWLLAYSPYLLIIALATGLGIRLIRRPNRSIETGE